MNPRRRPHLARRAPLTGSARVPGSQRCASRRIRSPAFEHCAGACDLASSSLLPRCAPGTVTRESNDMGRTLLTCHAGPATGPLPGLGETELCVALALAGDGLVGNGATGGPAAARRARGAPARGGVLRCPGLCPVMRKRSRLGMLPEYARMDARCAHGCSLPRVDWSLCGTVNAVGRAGILVLGRRGLRLQRDRH